MGDATMPVNSKRKSSAATTKAAPKPKVARASVPAEKVPRGGGRKSAAVNSSNKEETKSKQKTAVGKKAVQKKTVSEKSPVVTPSREVNSIAATQRKGRAPAKSNQEPPEKKLKLWTGHTDGGVVLTVGSGEMGQLGLGEDVTEKTRPAVVSEIPEKCQLICTGGMHTVCLTVTGEVWTFGCNDECALGRVTEEEEDCMSPGRVEIPGEIVVCISAGDSHTAALTQSGKLYIWGLFRDSSGPTGIQNKDVKKLDKPTLCESAPRDVVKICSGNDHLVLLTDSGDIYTLGSAEQGQLGRVAEYFVGRGGRRGLDLLLKADKVHFARKQKFCDIWAGQYVTFAKEKTSGDIYGWGLNNFKQIGLEESKCYFVPERVKNLDSSRDWKSFCSGQQHSLALDKDGRVYALGRKEYGRLGLGAPDQIEETSEPQLITSLSHITHIACGTTCSFAIDHNGVIYSWGASDGPLGQGNIDEDVVTPKQMTGQQLQNRRGLMVCAGGQHAVILARDQTPAATAATTKAAADATASGASEAAAAGAAALAAANS